MKVPCLILASFLFCISSIFAELPPSVYEAKQRSAPECLRLHIVDVAISSDTATPSVRGLAIVTEVIRTASEVKIGDTLQILYSVTSRPKMWCGPGEIPIPKIQEDTLAYLIKPPGKNFYHPAAGAMSFQNF